MQSGLSQNSLAKNFSAQKTQISDFIKRYQK